MRPRDSLDRWIVVVLTLAAIALLILGPWSTAVLWASTELLIGAIALYVGRRLAPLPPRPLYPPPTVDDNSTGGPPW